MRSICGSCRRCLVFDPAREARGVGIGQARDLVQRVVVDALEDRVEEFLHVAEVDGPAHHGVERGIQVQPQRVGVTVDAAATIAVRGARQAQRAVDRGLLPDAVVMTVEVRAATGGLEDGHPGELGQFGLQASPDPGGDHLAGGVLEAGDVVQAGVVEFGVDRCPQFVEVVVVDTDLACAEILVGVQDDFEAVTVHAAALVAGLHVGQTVGGLQHVAAPDVRVVVAVEVDAFVGRAHHADLEQARNLEMRADPAGEVLVGRLLELLVQVLVVERRQRARESCAQFVDFGAREGRPAVGQLQPRPWP